MSAKKEFGEKLPELPYGFSYEKFDGGRRLRIRHERRIGDDEKKIDVCGWLQCTGMTRDEEGQSYGKEIQFITDDGELRIVVISNAELQGEGIEVRRKFADLGLHIEPSRPARDSFTQLLSKIEAPGLRTTVVSKPGFHAGGTVFVSPVGHIIHSRTGCIVDDKTPVEPDEVGTENGMRYRLNPDRGAQDKRVGGSYKAWGDGVRAPIFRTEKDPETRIDNLLAPHFVLGLLTGCAGSVIQYADEPSSALHFVGGSSRGKSTAQVIGASCWANPAPNKGVMFNCRNTDNAVEMRFICGNGASVHLDEAQLGDPKMIAQLPFLFANETIKGRMGGGGKADILRQPLSWKTFLTLSSEKPISHYAEQARLTVLAGSVVRMISIDISELPPIEPDDARAIKEAALANFGHVGPRFVQTLMEHSPNAVRDMIYDAESRFRTEVTAPTVMRARRVFATLYVVAHIMREARIISSNEDIYACRAIQWAWNAFLTGEEAAALDPAEQSVDALLLWLRSNPHLVREVGDQFSLREVVAWYDDKFVYLPKVNFSKIPVLTTTQKAVLEALDLLDKLEWASDKNRQHRYIPKVGHVEHYRLKIGLNTDANTEAEQYQIEKAAAQRAKSGEKPAFAFR